ncbi:MAG: outer membrane protein [Alphaproteobacteria bacterium]
MRKLLLAAVASAAIASPAVAQNVGPYVGLEGGFLFPNKTNVDVQVFDSTGASLGSAENAFRIDYKNGFDIDAIAGYDFGLFRLEGELGYKRAGLKDVEVDPALIAIYEAETGTDVTEGDFDLDGHTSVLSGMLNGLVDFDIGGVGAYVGGGVGRASVKFSGDGDSDRDSTWAYQLLAGLRAPVSDNIDVGLKYRYFRTGHLNFRQDFTVDGEPFESDLSGRFSSHSVLASLIFNFGAPPAPPPVVPAAAPAPPPPAAAPATQTCPDGTVVLASEACPAAPPPPPPPPGERG